MASNRSLGQLEIARTLFLLGRFDGVNRTTRARRPTTRRRWRAIGPISPPSPRTASCGSSTSSRGAARARYLKRFWSERDRAELRADGERLREHYRRLFYARKNFQLTTINRHYDIVERYRSGSRDFDDRGSHLHPPRRAHQPGHLRRARARAQRVLALRPARRRPDLPLHRAGGRAGLQAGREPVRRARLQQARRAAGADNAADNPVAEQLMLLAGAAVADLPAAAGGRADRQRPVSGRGAPGGTGEHRGRDHHATATSCASPRSSRRTPRCWPSGGIPAGPRCRSPTPSRASLEPVTVTRGFLYCVRLRFVGAGPDRPGRGLAGYHPPLRRARAGAADEHLVGRVAVRCRPGQLHYRLAIQQGEDAGVVLPSDTVRVGRPELGRAQAERSGARQPDHQPGLAPTPSDTVLFNPLQTFKRARGDGAVLRGRGPAAGQSV